MKSTVILLTQSGPVIETANCHKIALGAAFNAALTVPGTVSVIGPDGEYRWVSQAFPFEVIKAQQPTGGPRVI